VWRQSTPHNGGDLVGMPPMQYLAKWRMQIASGLLSAGSVNIATVAEETGYGSEAASAAQQ